jgi:hypothetical protein
METTYLIDKDRELAETLLGRNEEIKSFQEKTNKEKVQFLKKTLRKLKPYLEESEFAFADSICVGDMWGLGSYYNVFFTALQIYTKKRHKECIGWNTFHGELFINYERIGDEVFCSYHTDGHPKKEFRHKWEFLNNDVKLNEVWNLEITRTKKITTIKETIDKIKFKPKKDGTNKN